MATAATMGPPPLDPDKEPRRSGRAGNPRRPTASSSGSTSKSPDFALPDPPPVPRASSSSATTPVHRPNGAAAGSGHQRSTSSSAPNGAGKRNRSGDPDDELPKGALVLNTSGAQNGRSKRKAKAKEKSTPVAELPPDHDVLALDAVPDAGDENDEDKSSVTRCICGRDDDSGGFYVACELCNVWQHGPCFGQFDEEACQSADYHHFCELCRPDLHQDLLEKRKTKRARQTSATAHAPPRSSSHSSRSRSPSHPIVNKQLHKRRNTLNSRLDDELEEILQATAAEAGLKDPPDNPSTSTQGSSVNGASADDDSKAKKRKRGTDDDARSAKRTRSASEAPAEPPVPAPPTVREPTPAAEATSTPKAASPPPPPPAAAPPKAKPSGSRSNKRGGARKPAPMVGADEDMGITPPTRKGGSSRTKTSGSSRRGGPSSLHISESASYRRGLGTSSGAPTPISARAYQQANIFGPGGGQPTWGLPDYLAHLEHILPSEAPPLLEVRTGAGAGTLEAERGVRVKWPVKRMSVADMNKRVRALVEWVSLQQAAAEERHGRADALVAAGAAQRTLGRAEPLEKPTMRMMEEFMEECISFQERFSGTRSRT